MIRLTPKRRARTLLCAIAKDEGPYLREWVDFHLSIGFGRIVIYDNESADPIRADRLSAGSRVEVRRWPTQAGHAPQLTAYADCLRRNRWRCDWLMYLDLDEFLNLKAHDRLADFLASYPDAAAVAVHWRVFGSGGAETAGPEPVTRRFTRAALLDFQPNHLVKTIFRPLRVKGAGVHAPYLGWGAKMVDADKRRLDPTVEHNYPPSFAVAQVNHYFTKSREEFLTKCARGRADLTSSSPDKFRSEAIFDFYDRNEEEDASILRHWRA